uniref:HYPK_UBA domain-containing protein n=1 Tax=Angiostrongylus cantonensis TaxID=6313 RepID=A0A0K0DJP0_ANGCA
MADKDDGLPDEDVKQNDKHNWGAADLEKVVNVVEEEKDDLRMSSDALGKIIANPQQPRQKIVNIKKDDLEMIMNELELPKSVVEKKLIEVNGDPIAAIKSFIGFDV